MNLNFNEICRLCLRFCEKYVDLNQTNGVKTLSKELAEKIKFCYLSQMDLSEELPTKVCYECIQVISYFYVAKKNVVISEQLLRDVLYVRKKLQDEAMMHREDNMTGSDIIEIKPEKQETNQSLLDVCNKPHNIISNNESNNVNLESNNISNLECRKNMLVSNITSGIVSTNSKKHNGFKVKKKKKNIFKYLQTQGSNNKLLGTLNVADCKSKVSVKLKVSKKLRCQPKRSSKSVKVDTTVKEAPKTDKTLEEFVVKEIGTIIDTSNILSPDVKRSRKTVLTK